MPAFETAAALAAVGGDLWANATNSRNARDTRKFQERMSNTALQRGVADARAAGLNPAMFYGHQGASTPSGDTARVENPLRGGVASALAAKEAKARIELLQQQAVKEGALAQKERIEADLMSTTHPGEPSYREFRISQRRAELRDMAFEGSLQPHMLRQAILDVMVKDLGIPEREAEAQYYKQLGGAAIGLRELSGPVGSAVGALGLSAAALRSFLKRGGAASVSSSARSLEGLFRAPAPRRVGTWEGYKASPKRPAGYQPNSP